MAKGKTGDKFANIAYLSCTEAVAGTLKFAQLAMANNLMSDKFAIIVHRVESYMAGIGGQFNASADVAQWALTLSDRVTDIMDLSQPEVLMAKSICRVDAGAAASGFLEVRPIIDDYTNLPGGGLLVPADRLYLGVLGSGLIGVLGVYMRLHYTVMPLDTSDYWELIEARRVMTT